MEVVDLLGDGLKEWRIPDDIERNVREVEGVLSLPASAHWTLPNRHEADFAWRLQFRPSPGSTAVLLLRGFLVPSLGLPGLRRGYEVRLPAPGVQGAVFVVWQASRPTEIAIPDHLLDLAYRVKTDWQTLVIEARKDVISITLNGTQLFAGTGAMTWAGSLGLRAMGAQVDWRQLRLEAKKPTRPFADLDSPAKGVTHPQLRREVKPKYPRGAMERGVEGVVLLACLVLEDGRVGDVRVTSSIDPDLDQEAVRAARKWQFSPARKDGRPVKAVVAIEMSFALQ